MLDYKYKMLIAGELVDAETTFDVINPADESLVGKAPDITPSQIEQVLEAAQLGFTTWSRMSLAEREIMIVKYVELLERDKSQIIDLLVLETGKPLDNAEYDFGMLTTCLKYFVEEAKRIEQPVIVDPDDRFHHYIQRQPLGVVVGYLAWNFPLLNLGYKLGPALAAGCSVIIKPSQVTPLASLKCAELAVEAGFPAGVINVITSNNYDITDPLLTNNDVALFTMIGSTQSGVKAMQTACTSVKHFSVELGGNAPVIVYDDADVEKAVNDIVGLKYTNSGQVCVSPNRCFVHRSIYDEFIRRAVEQAKQLTFGTGSDPGQILGPLSSKRELERVNQLVHSSVEQGAKLELGGATETTQPGFYLSPTILSNVNINMDIANQEIFGPVLPIIPFDDNDDIIALANQCEYGLSAYVYTSNLSKAFIAARDISAGSVCVNEVHYSVQLPHGGLKQSGVGKDCSKYSLQEYMTTKRVSILLS